ncbi:hypothetical protein V491_08224 [Pseudogymnoascus sp. VKM F-3775]|nr:hypothetical protein V491_08224 [Pseudogymnoascus sp. VKM F-3775]
MVSSSSKTTPAYIWYTMGDKGFHTDPYVHSTSKAEKRRIQNRLNQRRHRKNLKLAAAGLFEKPVPNDRRHITDNTLQPTNTYLRGRDVLPKCGQPPLTLKSDREVTCGGLVDKSHLESTSEGSTKISVHSVLAGGSRRQGFQPHNLQQGEEQNNSNCMSLSLHTTIQQQPDINTGLSISRAQHGTPSDEQESGLPMLKKTISAIIETGISDRAAIVSRGVPEGHVSILSRSQNGKNSQKMFVPARPQMAPHITAPTQDINVTLAQFRANIQQIFDLLQAPLVKSQVRATVPEQELNRRRNETMRLGRYVARMMIDIKHITEAIASIEAYSTIIDTLVVETSKAAQKRSEEKIGLYTRVNDLKNNLEAFQGILLDIALPY